MITNKLIEEIEPWLINPACGNTEINPVMDVNAEGGCCFEEFMMIELMQGYLKRSANIEPKELANKDQY